MNNMKIDLEKILLLLVAFVVVSCDGDESDMDSAEIPKTSRNGQTVDSRRNVDHYAGSEKTAGRSEAEETRPVSESELSEAHGLDLAPLVKEIARTKGLDSIAYLADRLDGRQLFRATSSAMNVLVEQETKADLIKEFSKLPAGKGKTAWMRIAIQEGQGGFGKDLEAAIRKIPYLEEKEDTLYAYASEVPAKSQGDVQDAITFIQSIKDLDKDTIEMLNETVWSSYVRGVMGKSPSVAADLFMRMPIEQQESSVKAMAVNLASDSPKTGYRPPDIQSLNTFFDKLNERSSSLAKAAYESGFQRLGDQSPSHGLQALDRVPNEFRSNAINSFVKGWISQDAEAASEWALQQEGEGGVAAAEAVVSYLEEKNSPETQLEPWKQRARR